MKDLEDEYNKRFNERELPNDDFDVEGLWDDIAADLDKGGDKPNGGQSNWWIGLGVGLLVIVAVVLYFTPFDESASDVLSKGTTPQVEQIQDLSTNPLPATSSAEGAAEVSDAPEKMTTSDKKESPLTSSNDANTTTTKNTSTQSLTGDLTNSLDHTPSTSRQSSQDQASGIKADLSQVSPSQVAGNERELSSARSENNLSEVAGNKDAPVSEAAQSSSADTQLNAQQDLENKRTAEVLSGNANAQIAEAVDSANRNTGESSSPASRKMTAAIPLIPTLQMGAIPFTDTARILDQTVPIRLSGIKPIVDKRFAVSLNAWGGANWANLNFQNPDPATATAKNNSEKTIPGFSTGLLASLAIDQKWRVASGLEFHQLNTQFSTTSENDTQLFKSQVLLGVVVDSSGNVVSSRIGDTTINAKVIRQIEHYNQFRQLSIPVELGFVKQSGSWRYGVMAGATFNFRLHQSGRTLDGELALIDFSNNSPDALYEKFWIGTRLSPFVDYRLTKQLSLSLRPQWNWSSQQIFTGSDFKVGIHQFNMNVGLDWRF